jgi:hypothetical protein
VTPYWCRACGEKEIAFGRVPEDRLCRLCHFTQSSQRPFTETDAGIPESFRNLTRADWETRFQRRWPASLESWDGKPNWIALWGPKGTGKSSLAAVVLAEHIRAGRRGLWISGPELASRIRSDFANSWEVVDPLLDTSLLVFDEPFTSTADWYLQRLLLIVTHRDDWGRPTIVTSRRLPELLMAATIAIPPTVLSRCLSGIRLPTAAGAVRQLVTTSPT